MTTDERGLVVDRRIAGAEHLARAAVRTFLEALPQLRARGTPTLLDDVDHLFSQVEAAETYVRLARTAVDPEEALEYAEDAYAFAHAALEDASARVRSAIDETAISEERALPLAPAALEEHPPPAQRERLGEG